MGLYYGDSGKQHGSYHLGFRDCRVLGLVSGLGFRVYCSIQTLRVLGANADPQGVYILVPLKGSLKGS